MTWKSLTYRQFYFSPKVLEKIDDHKSMCKIFHSGAKLIVNDLGIDKTLGWLHQNVTTEIKNYIREDWIVKTIAEHSIKIFKC